MMKNDLVSFCMPTYNQAEFLKECLKNLIAQAARHNIPIYVSDNASTDKTERIVREKQTIYPYIYYSRNSQNVGFDKNVKKVLEMSETKYSWLFGDKIRLIDGALEVVLDVLDGDNYDLVVVNGGKSTNLAKKAVKDITDPIVYSDSNRLLADLGWWMTLVGASIWNAEVIRKGEFDKYLGTEYVHVGVIFDYLSKLDFKVYWHPEPMIYGVREMRSSGWSSSKAVETFTKIWVDLIQSLPDRYTQKAKLKCIKDLPVKNKIFSLKGWLWLRGRGLYDFKVYQKYRDYFDYVTNVPKWVLLLINFIPKGLLAIIEKLYFLIIGDKT